MSLPPTPHAGQSAVDSYDNMDSDQKDQHSELSKLLQRVLRQRSHYIRNIVFLATIDIRNAFDSASWEDMIHALEIAFKTPQYIMKMRRSYLQEPELIYEIEGNLCTMKVTSSAAQGSILGPELWNICYMYISPDTYLLTRTQLDTLTIYLQ